MKMTYSNRVSYSQHPHAPSRPNSELPSHTYAGAFGPGRRGQVRFREVDGVCQQGYGNQIQSGARGLQLVAGRRHHPPGQWCVYRLRPPHPTTGLLLLPQCIAYCSLLSSSCCRQYSRLFSVATRDFSDPPFSEGCSADYAHPANEKVYAFALLDMASRLAGFAQYWWRISHVMCRGGEPAVGRRHHCRDHVSCGEGSLRRQEAQDAQGHGRKSR